MLSNYTNHERAVSSLSRNTERPQTEYQEICNSCDKLNYILALVYCSCLIPVRVYDKSKNDHHNTYRKIIIEILHGYIIKR